MQKTKNTFRKAKANEKSEKTNSFAAGVGLRLRPKSACATGVGLGATVSVDWCHQSGPQCWSGSPVAASGSGRTTARDPLVLVAVHCLNYFLVLGMSLEADQLLIRTWCLPSEH
jgi:hypothetical protein